MGVTFDVPGPVVPWQRTTSYQGRRLTPAAQREYQRRVGYLALGARPAGWPMDARYALLVTVYGSRRFDLDNAAKTLADACSGVLWDDDRQVDTLHVTRVRASRAESRVEVLVETVEEGK